MFGGGDQVGGDQRQAVTAFVLVRGAGFVVARQGSRNEKDQAEAGSTWSVLVALTGFEPVLLP